MFEAEFFAGVCEGERAVGCAVVCEQGLDVDAEPGVVGQSRMEEVQHRGACFIGIDGRKGDAAMVVDGDMDILGADALDGVAAVAGDAVAGPCDLDQALDVEM